MIIKRDFRAPYLKFFDLLIREVGVSAKQQKRHVESYVNSMQHHVLIHMISTYLNIRDVEKIAYTTWKRATNQTLIPKRNPTVMWQLKILHIPQRTNCLQNQNATNYNATLNQTPNQTRSPKPVGCC